MDFQRAWEVLGHGFALCLSYSELLADSSLLERWDVDVIRVDSAGENEEVTCKLIELGGGGSSLEFGEIAHLRQYYQGFCQVMEALARRGLPCWNDPGEIVVMFDKWACHQRFLRYGVARPPASLAPTSFAELRENFAGSGRLFLKPLHGSSASGVCALRWSAGRVAMSAPLRLEGGRLFNSLRVIEYTNLAEIEAILCLLLPQGMIAERWIPKLSLPGGVVDLRVLVIAGVARHRVVRQSLGPMTNLHLGNRRGDEEAVRRQVGEESWDSALRLAEKAAACFPRCLYAGVDILLDTSGRAWVGEINAFGDLLPGLVHDGESAYTAIARASDARCFV